MSKKRKVGETEDFGSPPMVSPPALKHFGGGGGSTQILVLYTCTTRARETQFFWDWMRFARIIIRGQNVSVFKKKGPLLTLLGGHLGVIFQTPLFHKTCSQKILFRGKIGCKNCAKFLFRAVFPQKGKSLLGYVFEKPLVTHVYNTSIRVATPEWTLYTW